MDISKLTSLIICSMLLISCSSTIEVTETSQYSEFKYIYNKNDLVMWRGIQQCPKDLFGNPEKLPIISRWRFSFGDNSDFKSFANEGHKLESLQLTTADVRRPLRYRAGTIDFSNQSYTVDCTGIGNISVYEKFYVPKGHKFELTVIDDILNPTLASRELYLLGKFIPPNYDKYVDFIYNTIILTGNGKVEAAIYKHFVTDPSNI